MHQFYHSPGACSLAVHIVLEEVDAPYVPITRLVQADASETTTEDYLRLNPKGRVPALSGVPGVAGGAPELLTEVGAILTYLARAYPATGLLPDDAAGQARCAEWLNWLSGDLHATGFGALWRPRRFADDPALHDAIRSMGRETIRAGFAHIETILSDGRDWAMSGQYSIVDPYLAVFWRWGNGIGLDMQLSAPHLTRLASKVLNRPAALRALQQEGLA